TAPTAVAEPVQFVTVDLANASMLVTGTNIIAVHGLNAGIGSSDLGLNFSLSTIAPDPTPPTIAAINPAPGTVGILNSITVTFSEPVAGVEASDLRINGVPATGLAGGNDTYTFSFPPLPYGILNITWAANAGIADFGIPANPFNTTGPGATWQYDYKDNIAPTVAFQLPFAGVTVRSLSQIEINFSEPVTGVDAADLLINGTPALSVLAPTASQYVFTVPSIAPGTVPVAFQANHGIQDLAVLPNAFAGASWNYVVDPNAVLNAVRINEIATANLNGLRDEDNEAQDWVELFNTSSNAVSLAGWGLTDDEDEPTKWVFPAVSIGARGYLVIFCSGKDRKPTTAGSRLHTNFKLTADGEFLGLFNAEIPRELISSFAPYPNQRNNYSYGYDPQDQLRYFQTPTPGTANGASTITGVVADTKFSHKRGFYEAPFSLSITCATPGVTIRYTTNGSAPTATAGLIYASPVAVAGTKIVRAAAFKTGLLPSDVDAQTYLFPEDIIRQPDEIAPAGWPAQKKANGGGQNYDYGMDPQIVNNATWAPLIKDSLQSVPTYSLVMDIAEFSSIYSNPGGDTITWERPASLELIYADDTEGFQANCGVRIRGGFSRSQDNPKHAFRIFFRQEYGLSKLNYPVFGPTGASSFDKFDLRTFQNYSWAFQGDARMMCVRDVSSRDAQLTMNGLSTRGNFCHLYINGVYWGLYNTEERPEAAFAESYLGGDADDYDVIKQLDGYISGATDGNTAAWIRLWQAATNGFANDTDYFRIQGLNVDGTPNPGYENLLDVPNLIDYMLVILYGGNLDAPISNFLGNDSPNNWYGFRDRTGEQGGFRFVSHDAEHTLLNVNEDRTGIVDLSGSGGQYGVIQSDWTCGNPLTQVVNGSHNPATAVNDARQRSTPQYVWFRLHQNAEFRMAAADRIQKHLFNGGPLSVEGMRASLLARSNELFRPIIAESARWGDAKVGTPFTRDTWRSAFATVWNSFVPGRTGALLNQLRADGLFPNVNAPSFNSYGGVVSNGFAFFMTNNNAGGVLYYTLDGTDPRVRGGNVSAAASAYTPGTPIIINFPTTIRARVRNGAIWSAVTEATFYPVQNFGGLRFTEIMYNPPNFGTTPSDDVEFLELKNVGSQVLDIGGLTFTDGITFTFTNRARIQPGQVIVLARNSTGFAAKYPGVAIYGIYTGRLDNGGELLTLSTPFGSPVVAAEYKDSGRWPVTADGFGFSLVPRGSAASANPSNPAYWRASTNPGGSPGMDDPEPQIPAMVVNEALTHTDLPLMDYIEIHNPTGTAVDIGGWYLTDNGGNPARYRIPNNTIIDAGGYLVFDESDFNATPGTNNSFTLDSHGESVYLLSGDPASTNLTGYSHGFSFGAAENGVSFGRHVISTGEEHFVAQLSRTPGAE
ncbi:MAG TPA: lamin tail domain-containing protein, partial [Verrucomicrobiae bacterium]|nr:lamin tail domain-containing protein [Verrucomicrobiae bacterium]